MSDIVTIYKYVMNLKTNEITVTPFIATKNDYKTHIAYVIKRGNVVFGRRFNFEVVKCRNLLIAWSLEDNKLNEFKRNCAKKIECSIESYAKYFERLSKMETALDLLKQANEVLNDEN